ncbi:tripartite tricarboxylate transporter substrate binding protein [Spiractinospora alimapuensis]|uniref:tripartite tricarboxylate transporter substrate binding protein n=1 Tax=Spiractinospora alimapuensis TaxID=2820884 RepID=UPI001F34245C|nr:tripartite tricarboxylate transporter substrate binding protein [Spiractinospora alimapuensis]QVQ50054.1 tripartite tricarboxylate transporter substrate binding protein [Spiractinospora alimapuensis]
MAPRGERPALIPLTPPLSLGLVLTLALTSCGLDAADDEEFPSRQIEVIVPWAAGGGTDQTVRQLATAAEEPCGVDIIVSNQEGGGSAIGHQAVADAEPDGYTLGAATIEVSILNHLGGAEVTPDDLQGVMKFSANPAVLSVANDSEFQSVGDLVDAMESDDTVRIATNGTGGIWDIAAGGLEVEAGAEFTERVPFDGGADMIAAVMGGQVEAIAPSGAESVDHMDAGELRPLATMAEDRLERLPDTPTLVEEGVDWTAANWFGLVVPNDVDAERVAALNECFAEAFEAEEFVDFMDTQGFVRDYLDAEQFEAFMDEEFEQYADLIDTLYGES